MCHEHNYLKLSRLCRIASLLVKEIFPTYTIDAGQALQID